MAVDFDPVRVWVLRCRLCGEMTKDDSNESRLAHAWEHVRKGDAGGCDRHGCLKCAAGVGCDDHLSPCGPRY